MSSFNESMERVEQAAHHTGRSEMVNDCSRLIVKSIQLVEQMIDERRQAIKEDIYKTLKVVNIEDDPRMNKLYGYREALNDIHHEILLA